MRVGNESTSEKIDIEVVLRVSIGREGRWERIRNLIERIRLDPLDKIAPSWC
jgi:hypothetical protein